MLQCSSAMVSKTGAQTATSAAPLQRTITTCLAHAPVPTSARQYADASVQHWTDCRAGKMTHSTGY